MQNYNNSAKMYYNGGNCSVQAIDYFHAWVFCFFVFFFAPALSVFGFFFLL